MYKFARQNPDKEFLIPYDNESNLNAYSSQEMANMFSSFDIPSNVKFKASFLSLMINSFTEYENVTSLSERGKIEMQPDNISKILNGKKTITNRRQKFEDGIYKLPNGVQVKLEFIGRYKVFNDNTPRIYMLDDSNNKLRSMLKDDFAKQEGFEDWNDFEKNNKYSSKFIKGDEIRYVYSVKPIFEDINKPQQLSLFTFSPEEQQEAERLEKECKGSKPTIIK